MTLRDAVVDYLTPGIPRGHWDRVMAFHLQARSMADLSGYRLKCLPSALVEGVFEELPPDAVGHDVSARWHGESSVVQNGRAHLLSKWGRVNRIFVKPIKEIRRCRAV